MPVIDSNGVPYQLPYMGQVFQREQQDGRWELAFVNGVRFVYVEREVDGKKQPVIGGWTASLTMGFVDFRYLLKMGATYTSTHDWHPAPSEKQMSPEALTLLLGLGRRLGALEDRLAALENRRSEASDEGLRGLAAREAPPTSVAPERPRRGATA